VVKVIWHKTASPPQTDAWLVFARWRQSAVPCGHIGVTWRIRRGLCTWPRSHGDDQHTPLVLSVQSSSVQWFLGDRLSVCLWRCWIVVKRLDG